ncbi:MAG: hypothetical protein JWN24_4135 [Phycisphaerales bacterium]|nr:hypothetical protein [Phycisphaerales bacterium]
MKLSEFYPLPDDLIRNEVSVLNYLRNDPYIKENHSEFAKHAEIYYGRSKNGLHQFEFFSYLDIWHAAMVGQKRSRRRQGIQKPNLRLILAARIELSNARSYENITYCLSVCKKRGSKYSILRKFHFDITVSAETDAERLQQHPTSHLQYCGEMIPAMEKIGIRQAQLDQLYPWLSEPRIFFPPMSLALLVDLAFHEFPDSRSKKFRSSSEWRGIIRSQESLVLLPFFEKCVGVINKKSGSLRLLSEEFYVD